MASNTFKNGVHPNDSKQYTSECAITDTPKLEGSTFVYPLLQHIGAPCEPIVAKGDRVLVGQKIGEAKAFVSSPIFSTVSGEVADIAQSLTPGGTEVLSVYVKSDDKYEQHPSIQPKKPYTEYTKEEKLDIIKEAGIVGLGGAGFPSHIKLNPPKDKTIDTVIVNGCECEPYLTTDYRAMLENGENVVAGLLIVLSMMDSACKGVIAIEDNKPKAIARMTELTAGKNGITVQAVKTKYPQGSEKQLIYAVTGREVPSGKLPADAGCIVHNIDTLVSINRAFVTGMPLIERIVTISGGAVKKPGNYRARLGMSYRQLIEQNGGFNEPPAKVISGGPMMGIALYSLDVPIVKTSSGILCFTEKEAYIPKEKSCIRCAKCVSACPVGLMPYLLNKNAIVEDMDSFKENNGVECVECGSCSYVCPSKRHLAQSIRATKKIALTKKA